jgi:hypothetical protein
MPDRYTKIMLTIIAAALLGLVAQNAVNSGRAATGVQHVVICDSYEPSDCARVATRGSGSDSSNFLLVSGGLK